MTREALKKCETGFPGSTAPYVVGKIIGGAPGEECQRSEYEAKTPTRTSSFCLLIR